MNKLTILSVLFLLPQLLLGQAKKKTILPADVQIRAALMAAPEEFREGATVVGCTPEGKWVTLREGTNDMVCLAPNPKQIGVYVYAYPKRLEPFMARGRELAAQGKRINEKDTIRDAEIKAGTLPFPKDPTILYGYYGKDEDLVPATGEIKNGTRRYVVYVPYATAASTGMPTEPNIPGMPWLMSAGTFKAHIMINPENMGHQH